MVMSFQPAKASPTAPGTTQSSVLFTAQADGVVTNLATPAPILGAGGVGLNVAPANSLILGRTVRLKAKGFLTTSGLDAGFVAFVVIGALQVSSPECVINVGNAAPWNMEIDITPRSLGSPGSVEINGYLDVSSDGSGASGVTRIPIFSTSAQALATTIANTITLNAKWTDALATNSITCTGCTMELVGP